MLEYTIKIALTHVRNLTAVQIAKQLQAVYDSVNVAGTFNVELIGTSIAIVTFTRDLNEDLVATGRNEPDVDPQWVANQLFQELSECFEYDGMNPEEPARQIMFALKNQDCTVTGLPYQKPRLRLYLEVAYETQHDRDNAAAALTSEAISGIVSEYMSQTLARSPTLLAGLVEPDPRPMPTEQSPKPVRIAMDLTGGTIQWALSDRPVEFMVIDDEISSHDRPGEAEPITVNVTDKDGVQTMAHKPGPMDMDPETVEHFFSQTR